jgi:hypothetical protein
MKRSKSRWRVELLGYIVRKAAAVKVKKGGAVE